MFNTCLTHVQQLSKTSPKHIQHICETCPEHVQPMSNTSPTHVQNMSETCPTLVPHMSNICLIHVQHMSKICVKRIQIVPGTFCLIVWLIYCLVDWLNDWLVEWLINWLIDWLISHPETYLWWACPPVEPRGEKRCRKNKYEATRERKRGYRCWPAWLWKRCSPWLGAVYQGLRTFPKTHNRTLGTCWNARDLHVSVKFVQKPALQQNDRILSPDAPGG